MASSLSLLKKFEQLNVNTDMMVQDLKHLDLNARTVSAVLKLQGDMYVQRNMLHQVFDKLQNVGLETYEHDSTWQQSFGKRGYS